MHSLLGSRVRRAGILAVSGALTGLTLVMPSALGWLEWISMIPAVLVLLHMSAHPPARHACRALWGAGFVFFVAFYLVVYHWFWYLYPLSFTGLTPAAAAVVMLVAWFGLSLFQGVGMAFTFVAVYLLWRCAVVVRHALLRPLLLAAVLTVAEWLQTLFWFGVPWGRLSLGQVAYLPLVQTASWFGCYGITFLLVAVNAAAAQLLLTPAGRRRGLCALACGLFAGNLLAGSMLLAVGDHRTPERTLRVGVVQSNLGAMDRQDLTMSQVVRLHEQHMETLADVPLDLVLWSETAMPFLIEDYPRYLTRVGQIAQRGTLTLCTGTFTRDENGTEYNSVLTFCADGSLHETAYHKQHPVPFGEFVPLRALVTTLIPPLASLNMWESELLPGTEAAVVEDDNGRYGFMICFDSIFEATARDSVRNGAQLLLLPTNDSWFLDSAAGVMHLSQARLRAIENGRGIARSACTGISAIITPTGRMTQTLDAQTCGTLTGEMGLYSHTTLYNLLGNWFVFVCVAACACPAGHEIWRRMRTRLDKSRQACYNS